MNELKECWILKHKIHIWQYFAAIGNRNILHVMFFFLNGPSPASFSFIFGIFQTNLNKILQQINVKKCPSSLRHWDSNTWPSECESPPITTRPGLPSHIYLGIQFDQRNEKKLGGIEAVISTHLIRLA